MLFLRDRAFTNMNEQLHRNHHSSNFPLFQALPVGQDWPQNFRTCFTFRLPRTRLKCYKGLYHMVFPPGYVTVHHSLVLEVPRFDPHRFDWSYCVARVNRTLWSYGDCASSSMVCLPHLSPRTYPELHLTLSGR